MGGRLKTIDQVLSSVARLNTLPHYQSVMDHSTTIQELEIMGKASRKGKLKWKAKLRKNKGRKPAKSLPKAAIKKSNK